VELTRQSTRASRLVLATLAVASAATALVLGAFPTAASAEPEPAPPSLVAVAPTITSPADGDFLGSENAVVTGTKAAGSTVQVLAGSSRTNVCTDRSAGADFSCPVTRLPSGPGITLTAVQLVDGAGNLESDPVRVDILAPPTIAGESPLLTNGLVQGAGYPDADITLSVGGDTTWTFPAGPDGGWAYVLPRTLASGTYTVTATQSTPFSSPAQSDPSAPRTISLDVDPPAAPTVDSPTAASSIRSSGVVYAGTGEKGATVDVFALTASGSEVAVCSATVSAGLWRCEGATLPAGTVIVTAYQTDAAGNVGNGSDPLSVTVASPPTKTPRPVPSPSPSDEPAVAPVVPPAPPSASPSPAAPPTAPEPPREGNWEAATPFTTAVPSALAAADLSWLRALVLAAIAILLLLVPARMLATTIAARRGRRSPLSLTGRNRVPTHDDPVRTVPSEKATSILLVGLAGAILLLANPVHGEPEYLRVLLASVVAVAVLNVAATVVPALLSRRLPSGSARVSLSPRLLLAVAAVALVSRMLDLQPALLFGMIFTVTAVSGTRSARGIVAGIRIAAVFAAGLVAWLGSTLLGSPTGFFDSLLIETANIAAMAGVGSAAILLIPLGRLDGRALLVWSRPAWFGSATVVLTVLFALLAPVVDLWGTSGDVVVALLIVLGFGALGLSLWIWRRAIQPALASD
jgi:hypothetical protein